MQGEVPEKRPAQIPHVRQPPRAGGAQSQGHSDEDEKVRSNSSQHRYKLVNIISLLGLVSRENMKIQISNKVLIFCDVKMYLRI